MDNNLGTLRGKLFVAGIIIGLALVFFVFTNDPDASNQDSQPVIEEGSQEQNADDGQQVVDQWSYEDYNFQFAEGPVLGTLDSLIGDEGKVAFYLPPTKYIEVQPGQSFGVAFALANPQPDPDNENYFVYSFTPSQETVDNCNTPAPQAQSWISMGQNSFGKIPKGWIDKMTVYFEFPQSINDCTAKYDFVVTRDGQPYGSQELEFRIQ